MTGIVAFLPILQAIGSIASIGGMLMGSQSAPQMLPPPPAPAPVPAPEVTPAVPDPVVSSAPGIAVGDAQTAQQDAVIRRKRAKAAEDQRLMTLESAPQAAPPGIVDLTKSILGE